MIRADREAKAWRQDVRLGVVKGSWELITRLISAESQRVCGLYLGLSLIWGWRALTLTS